MEAHFVHLDENKQPLVLAVLYEVSKTNLPPVFHLERHADDRRKSETQPTVRRIHPTAETVEILPLCRFADHAAVHRGRIMVGVENL